MSPAARPSSPVRFLVLVTLAWGLLLASYAQLTPMYRVPDEPAHLDAAVRLAEGLGWPPPGEARYVGAVWASIAGTATTTAEDRPTLAELARTAPEEAVQVDQMTQHPPTWYLLAAGVLRLVGYEDLRTDHVVMTLRALDVLLVLPLPWLVHATALRVTGSRRTALTAAVALFAVPQLAQVASGVTNDALAILLGAVLTWTTARVLTGADRLRDAVVVGVVLGALLATKGTGLPGVPFVALVLLLAGRPLLRLRTRLVRTVAALGTAFAIGGWWWLRNILVLGDVQPSGLAAKRPPVDWPAGTGPDVDLYVGTMWDGLSASFWGRLGRVEYALPAVVTDVLTVLALLGVAAAVLGRRRPVPRRALLLATSAALGLAFLVINTGRIYARTGGIHGVQGRYLFVEIVALVVVVAVGWRSACRTDAGRRALAVTAVSGSAVLAVAGLLTLHHGAYHRSLVAPDQGLALWARTAAWGAPAGVATGVALLVALAVVTVLTVRALGRTDEDAPAPEGGHDHDR